MPSSSSSSSSCSTTASNRTTASTPLTQINRYLCSEQGRKQYGCPISDDLSSVLREFSFFGDTVPENPPPQIKVSVNTCGTCGVAFFDDPDDNTDGSLCRKCGVSVCCANCRRECRCTDISNPHCIGWMCIKCTLHHSSSAVCLHNPDGVKAEHTHCDSCWDVCSHCQERVCHSLMHNGPCCECDNFICLDCGYLCECGELVCTSMSCSDHHRSACRGKPTPQLRPKAAKRRRAFDDSDVPTVPRMSSLKKAKHFTFIVESPHSDS